MIQVDQVRARLVRGFDMEVKRVRIYLSMMGSHNEELPLLMGENGDKLVAKLTEITLAHLGHDEGKTAGTSNSRTLRAVRKGT